MKLNKSIIKIYTILVENTLGKRAISEKVPKTLFNKAFYTSLDDSSKALLDSFYNHFKHNKRLKDIIYEIKNSDDTINSTADGNSHLSADTNNFILRSINQSLSNNGSDQILNQNKQEVLENISVSPILKDKQAPLKNISNINSSVSKERNKTQIINNSRVIQGSVLSTSLNYGDGGKGMTLPEQLSPLKNNYSNIEISQYSVPKENMTISSLQYGNQGVSSVQQPKQQLRTGLLRTKINQMRDVNVNTMNNSSRGQEAIANYNSLNYYQTSTQTPFTHQSQDQNQIFYQPPNQLTYTGQNQTYYYRNPSSQV
eukprot:CAMPEP_0170526542 /NCGR_PEP_ID=MMETSP0209-20121228/11936_1 /TAXON_ID=665100 ORGANISM="Litonotus pictus, Strain P1" /NCGR_SAMPLE_ID=MMETSP0209 /ASSEMBLY_ACC=CAM_ASM_000301 /LENGTH=312 /DNA_ID=CAMNT_0010816407 /DNA_START=741 /DNA_END=1679 /DNA_ORIENTATION=+